MFLRTNKPQLHCNDNQQET